MPPLCYPVLLGWTKGEERCFWQNWIQLQEFHWHRNAFSPPCPEWLFIRISLGFPLFYSRKLIIVSDAISSQGRQQPPRTCLKCPFSSLISDPSESCYQCLHIFGNWLSLHCKDVAWMITPQPEMSASWHTLGDNKGHSWWGRGSGPGEISMGLIFVFK